MHSFRPLGIKGYRDEPVPNTFFQQDEPARKIAIVLPGVGYTCQMPLLYYPTRLLLSLGMDVLWVEYSYSRRSDYLSLPEAEQKQWLCADVTAACQAALAQRPYQQVLLMGKSLGTLAMSHLLATEARLAHSPMIWLTPLLRNDKLRSQIQNTPRGLVVIGTADHQYDPAYLAEIQSKGNCEVVVVDGADHSIEVKDNVWQSLQVIERVTRAIQTFVASAKLEQ
jgi:hypothetical protein